MLSERVRFIIDEQFQLRKIANYGIDIDNNQQKQSN